MAGWLLKILGTFFCIIDNLRMTSCWHMACTTPDSSGLKYIKNIFRRGGIYNMRSLHGVGSGLLIAALLVVGLAVAVPASADTFQLTSCHVSGGCTGDIPAFGTVTLTQSGSNVNFVVSLANGNRFVETGSGGGALFIFNDPNAGHTVTSISTSPNSPAGGLSGSTNVAPFMADGTGFWTARVEC